MCTSQWMLEGNPTLARTPQGLIISTPWSSSGCIREAKRFPLFKSLARVRVIYNIECPHGRGLLCQGTSHLLAYYIHSIARLVTFWPSWYTRWSIQASFHVLGSVYSANAIMAMRIWRICRNSWAKNPDVMDTLDALHFQRATREILLRPWSLTICTSTIHHKVQTVDSRVSPSRWRRVPSMPLFGQQELVFRFYDVLGGAVMVNGDGVRSVEMLQMRS